MPRRKTIEALEGRLLLSSSGGTVIGSVFLDYNGNDVREPNEPPASHVRVWLSAGLPDPGSRYAVTDSQGRFRISHVEPGSYELATVSGEQSMTTPDLIPVDVTAGQVSRLSPFGVDDGYPILAYSSNLSATVISRLSSNIGSTDIARSPNGDLYTNAPNHNSVLQITPSGVVTELPDPTQNAEIGSLAASIHGNIWFTEPGDNAIGSLSAASDFSTFAIPTPSSNPFGIAVDDIDNVWFTERSANQIGLIQNGHLNEYQIPTAGSQPTAIAMDGEDPWFIESNADKIGEDDLHYGTFREFPLQPAQGTPQRIVQGPDGNLWFTLDNPAGIGVINNSGVDTVYPISTPGSAPLGIIDGPNGTLAFTDPGANALGEITTTGQITESPISTPNSQPDGLAMDSGGSIWFVEADVPAIAMARQSPPPFSQSLKEAKPVDLLDFSDKDLAARLSNYKVTINWGDGGKTTSGRVKKKSSGIFSVIGKHRFKAAGTYTISMTVFDRAGSLLTRSVIATITS